MSDRRNSLSPPERTDVKDPGAHELDTSDSDDHFSDAQSGPGEAISPHSPSPIPRTRVEKVDDEPSYGEVPGTEAYRMREEDAMPDEIAIVPDREGPPSLPPLSRPSAEGEEERERPRTPGGHPIPKTMVEETVDTAGSVRHPEIEMKHRADPPPDLVLKADGSAAEDGSAPVDDTMSPAGFKTPNSTHDDSGDDFDEFEEGDEDGDFGDFDDGFQQADADADVTAAPTPAPQSSFTAVPPASSLSFPIPDFDELDYEDIVSVTEPYLSALFPIDESDFAIPPPPQQSSKDGSSTTNTNSIFLTPRSASLWAQLVAPPPLQPPDWIRSRIRRLFLVSLGVPVDLDEILPASSKQKKLVLPSPLHHAASSGSLRTSSDSRSASSSRQRHNNHNHHHHHHAKGLQQQQQLADNASTTSLDSQGKPRAPGSGSMSSKRKGPPPEPAFDLVAAKQLCTTTDAALDGMTDQELRRHVKKLEALEGTAKEVLEFWTRRTDEKIGDREAFEGVIENLVKHARKVRK